MEKMADLENIPKAQLENECDVAYDCSERHDYPLCIGDNPSGVRGPPISLDWAHHGKLVRMLFSIDNYERERRPSRDAPTLQMAVLVHMERLIDAGYLRHKILALTKPLSTFLGSFANVRPNPGVGPRGMSTELR